MLLALLLRHEDRRAPDNDSMRAGARRAQLSLLLRRKGTQRLKALAASSGVCGAALTRRAAAAANVVVCTYPHVLDPKIAWLVRGCTPRESVVVCDEAQVPAGVTAERGFRALAVEGPLEFSLVGVLAALTKPLAVARLSVSDTSPPMSNANTGVCDGVSRLTPLTWIRLRLV